MSQLWEYKKGSLDKMWRLKACPKCGGSMRLEEEEWKCFNCGYYEVKNMDKKKPYNLRGIR